MAVLALNCGMTSASNETLSLRATASGSFEALITGLTEFCDRRPIYNVNSVEIEQTLISINSVRGGSGGGCSEPLPAAKPYQFAVPLGPLMPGTYTIAWTTSDSTTGPRTLFLSGVFAVDVQAAMAIPTMSDGPIVALVALLMAIGGTCVNRMCRREASANRTSVNATGQLER